MRQNLFKTALFPIAVGVLLFLAYRLSMLAMLSILIFLGNVLPPVARLYAALFGFSVLGIGLIDFLYPLVCCRAVVALDRFARRWDAYTKQVSRRARITATALIIAYHVLTAAYAAARDGFHYTLFTEQLPYILFALGIGAA